MIDLDKVIPRTQQERIALETLKLLRDISNNVSKLVQQEVEVKEEQPVKKTKRGGK